MITQTRSITCHTLVGISIILCWAHNSSIHNQALLCRDGTYVNMSQHLDASRTTECHLHEGRMRCPPAYPFMCRHRHRYATDYHCVASKDECSTFGGVRSCNRVEYNMIGLPALEQVPFDAEKPVTTAILSRSFESELMLDSVSDEQRHVSVHLSEWIWVL